MITTLSKNVTSSHGSTLLMGIVHISCGTHWVGTIQWILKCANLYSFHIFCFHLMICWNQFTRQKFAEMDTFLCSMFAPGSGPITWKLKIIPWGVRPMRLKMSVFVLANLMTSKRSTSTATRFPDDSVNWWGILARKLCVRPVKQVAQLSVHTKHLSLFSEEFRSLPEPMVVSKQNHFLMVTLSLNFGWHKRGGQCVDRQLQP